MKSQILIDRFLQYLSAINHVGISKKTTVIANTACTINNSASQSQYLLKNKYMTATVKRNHLHTFTTIILVKLACIILSYPIKEAPTPAKATSVISSCAQLRCFQKSNPATNTPKQMTKVVRRVMSGCWLLIRTKTNCEIPTIVVAIVIHPA